MSVSSCDMVADVNQDSDINIPFYENQDNGSRITAVCTALGSSIIGIQAARTFLPSVVHRYLPIVMGVRSSVFYSTANLLALCFFSVAYVFYNKIYYLDPDARKKYNQDLVDKKVSLGMFLNTHSFENIEQFGFQLPKEKNPIITIDQFYSLASSELVHHKLEWSDLENLITETQIEEEKLRELVCQRALEDFKNGSLELSNFIRCWEKGYTSSCLARKACEEKFFDDKISIKDFIFLCKKGLFVKDEATSLITAEDVSRKALTEFLNGKLIEDSDFIFLWEKGWMTPQASYQVAQAIADRKGFPAFFTVGNSISCEGILFDFLSRGMISQKQLQAILVNFLLKDSIRGSGVELILPALFFTEVSEKLWGREGIETSPLFKWLDEKKSLYLSRVKQIFALDQNMPLPTVNFKVSGSISVRVGSLSADGMECSGKLFLHGGNLSIGSLIMKNGATGEINSSQVTLGTLIVSNADLYFSPSTRIAFSDKRGSLMVNSSAFGMIRALLGSPNMFVNREKMESFNKQNEELLLEFKKKFPKT